jgi:transcriptional regulator with XRE-family HTH domain
MATTKSAIRTARRNKDITQEQLADQFNVTRVTVSNWERKFTTPTVHELVMLAVFLDVTLEELMNDYKNKEI